ncbi:hypothetical protein [Streptomyces sp. CC208A]|uniref:hypothetical protein n=1 Tax=Streptomyces sp. CC208A TaxID=3044573 RepID=UPI0024A899B6|nr:hypothetical protein [Streptomyces sp. CC208A]
MISEPELEGGTPFDTTEVLTEERGPRPPRSRRPWLWALGGAVLASAVWGGGLYAYGLKKEESPDLGGYKTPVALCELAQLKALTTVLGERGDSGGEEAGMDDPVLYSTGCDISFGPGDSGYHVSLRYTLHKVTDPGPEFKARAKDYGLVTEIGGLGEQALFDDSGGEGGQLRVLDGQAEIELNIYRNYSIDDEGNPVEPPPSADLSGIDVPIAQDVLALMEALKK